MSKRIQERKTEGERAVGKGYVEKVFTNLRHKLENELFNLKTNVLIWGLFIATKMKSEVHFAREYQQN